MIMKSCKASGSNNCNHCKAGPLFIQTNPAYRMVQHLFKDHHYFLFTYSFINVCIYNSTPKLATENLPVETNKAGSVKKRTLPNMGATGIVHFVRFETTLDAEAFIKRWEDYNWSAGSDRNITLQQSEKNGVFRYIAQHWCTADGLNFMFTKTARSPRMRRAEIRATLIGGYSVWLGEAKKNVPAGETKFFVFLTSPPIDLNVYKRLTVPVKLNIYTAYYESCQYSCILEYFVRDEYVMELQDQLKQFETAETGMYKECAMQAV